MTNTTTETIESKLIDAYVKTFKMLIDKQKTYANDGSFTKVIAPWYNKNITSALGHNTNSIDITLLPKVNKIITDYSIDINLRYKHEQQQTYEIIFKPK